MTAKEMDNSDLFIETWKAMMESNYQKEAQPHEGAYHMHLNEILVNVTVYLEEWANKYVPMHREEIVQFFFDNLHKKFQEKKMDF